MCDDITTQAANGMCAVGSCFIISSVLISNTVDIDRYKTDTDV